MNSKTDHVVKENHVIGWDEANRSARWTRESIEIRKQDIQGHIPCHFSTMHFSPQQRHLAEKIGTGSHFDKSNRCCRNVNNNEERFDYRILIMSGKTIVGLCQCQKTGFKHVL